MSISSMTNVALSRREGVDVTSYKTLAAAASGQAPAQSDATAALKAISSYIPSEILTVYVGVLGALQQGGALPPSARTAFWGFLIGTPVVVWLVYAAKVRAGGGDIWSAWPLWEMFAATVAFGVWGLALPDSPFKEVGWYSPAIAGVMVLVVSMLLGLVAPLVQKK